MVFIVRGDEMIVKNKRLDLMYKKSDDVVMVCDSLTMALDTDQRLIYALIANFEHGIDVEYVLDIMELTGWTQLQVYDTVKYLLDLDFIGNVTSTTDVEKMKLEFDDFKGQVLQDK
ncbi:MAG: hypothetical protein ACRCXT_02230 [Paraclostridium sp.]